MGATSSPSSKTKSSSSNQATKLSGTWQPAPRPMWATALLAVVGWLLLLQLGRLFAKYVLSHRHTCEVERSPAGLLVRTRFELLGRVLRDAEMVIPRGGLMRATRDIRYPSLPTYAGLLALALGSYIGVGLVVDGVRVASASLFGIGALVTLFGLGVDFLLSSLLPGTSGKCRLILVPRRGPVFCVGLVDPAAADALLGQLAADSSDGADAPAGRASTRSKPRIEAKGADLPAKGTERDSAREAG